MKINKTSIIRTIAGVLCSGSLTLSAADAGHGKNGGYDYVSLSTPIVTQNPSIKTKIKAAYVNSKSYDGTYDKDKNKLKLELEYKVNKHVGLNFQLPYTSLEKTKRKTGKTEDYDNVDNLELTLKFANHAYGDKGMVIGYGLGLGLPTGDDNKSIGSDHDFRIKPYVSVGKAYDKVEIIAHTNLVFNQNGNSTDVDNSIEYNLSVLYKFSTTVSALVEFNGDSQIEGDKHTVINVSPGIKFTGDKHNSPYWEVALGTSFPLTDDEHFEHELNAQFSLFF